MHVGHNIRCVVQIVTFQNKDGALEKKRAIEILALVGWKTWKSTNIKAALQERSEQRSSRVLLVFFQWTHSFCAILPRLQSVVITENFSFFMGKGMWKAVGKAVSVGELSCRTAFPLDREFCPQGYFLRTQGFLMGWYVQGARRSFIRMHELWWSSMSTEIQHVGLIICTDAYLHTGVRIHAVVSTYIHVLRRVCAK